MKTIIAPVDFSSSSVNALAFAGELTKRANARLIIMHAGKIDKDNSAEEKLKLALEELKKTYENGLNCEAIISSGSLVDALKEMIVREKPDLIVMGTNGASNLKEIIIGSNTVNVIAKTKLPILVIPVEARFENFLRRKKNKVVLATDLAELTEVHVLQTLKEIALMIIEAKVRVLNVRPENTHLKDLSRLERDFLLSYFNPEIESERMTVFSDNVISGINWYLSQNEDVGLLAMIARDSGTLIQKHFTREMASNTTLPLLVLREE